MKRIRPKDRKFILVAGATALLILFFFLGGWEVAKVVVGGARRVDAEKIQNLIQEGELSAEEAKYSRAVPEGEEVSP